MNKFIYSVPFAKYSETSVRAASRWKAAEKRGEADVRREKKYHYAISVNCFYIHPTTGICFSASTCPARIFSLLASTEKKYSAHVFRRLGKLYAQHFFLCASRFFFLFSTVVSTSVDFRLNNEEEGVTRRRRRGEYLPDNVPFLGVKRSEA